MHPYRINITDQQNKASEILSQLNEQKKFFFRINITFMIKAYHEHCVEN